MNASSTRPEIPGPNTASVIANALRRASEDAKEKFFRDRIPTSVLVFFELYTHTLLRILTRHAYTKDVEAGELYQDTTGTVCPVCHGLSIRYSEVPESRTCYTQSGVEHTIHNGPGRDYSCGNCGAEWSMYGQHGEDA